MEATLTSRVGIGRILPGARFAISSAPPCVFARPVSSPDLWQPADIDLQFIQVWK